MPVNAIEAWYKLTCVQLNFTAPYVLVCLRGGSTLLHNYASTAFTGLISPSRLSIGPAWRLRSARCRVLRGSGLATNRALRRRLIEAGILRALSGTKETLLRAWASRSGESTSGGRRCRCRRIRSPSEDPRGGLSDCPTPLGRSDSVRDTRLPTKLRREDLDVRPC